MLTAAYTGDSTITISSAEPAPPGPGEVQLRVAYVGLCGTDLHILHGNMDARVETPLVFGHEMSGTIAAIGDGVEGWNVGDAPGRGGRWRARVGQRTAECRTRCSWVMGRGWAR